MEAIAFSLFSATFSSNYTYVDTLHTDILVIFATEIFLLLKREIIGLKYSFKLVWLKFQNNFNVKIFLMLKY